MSKVLITTSSFNMETPEIKALQNAGYEVVLNPHKRRLNEQEITELLTPEIEGLIAGLEPLNAGVINGAEGLKVISRCGIGMDNVDMDAAHGKQVKVFNTPDGPTAAVAELAIGLVLDVLRGITRQDRAMRSDGWERPMGGLLGARTLGLIGYGRIGQRVGEIAKSFGSDVLAYDPASTNSASLDDVLSQADIISLHIPYTDDNHHFINAEKLARMKESAILVNTARGGLVDEAAVCQALQSGALSGAAFDVFEEEPYKGPLRDLDNVVLTAHVGSYAKEARERQEAQAAENLLAGLREGAEGIRAYG